MSCCSCCYVRSHEYGRRVDGYSGAGIRGTSGSSVQMSVRLYATTFHLASSRGTSTAYLHQKTTQAAQALSLLIGDLHDFSLCESQIKLYWITYVPPVIVVYTVCVLVHAAAARENMLNASRRQEHCMLSFLLKFCPTS